MDKYDIGTGFGHFGIAVEDVRSAYRSKMAQNSLSSNKKGSCTSCLLSRFCQYDMEEIREEKVVYTKKIFHCVNTLFCWEHMFVSQRRWIALTVNFSNRRVSYVILQVQKVVDLVKAKGGKVTRETGPVKGGKSIIAFVEDPDGYKFELIQRPATPEPLCQIMLRVGDLDRAIEFYEKVLFFFPAILSLCMSRTTYLFKIQTVELVDFACQNETCYSMCRMIFVIISFNIIFSYIEDIV